VFVGLMAAGASARLRSAEMAITESGEQRALAKSKNYDGTPYLKAAIEIGDETTVVSPARLPCTQHSGPSPRALKTLNVQRAAERTLLAAASLAHSRQHAPA
jgi:hypothetical protein